uniref:Photosystem II reaction center PsbP family protein n=1 Tax=Cypripedium formosanum TaxID=53042 RepID=A0A0F7GYT2_9ASPA
MAIPLSLSHPTKRPCPNPNPSPRLAFRKTGFHCWSLSRRAAILETAAGPVVLAITLPASSNASSSPDVALDGISNTRSWFQFSGDGFSIRIPPLFEDIMEPEDLSAGQTFYGDKAKPKMFAARFASPDGSEVLSVVIRPSNQLKITFLEAKDITDLGSLKESAKFFVPGGANLYAARRYKIKEEAVLRTYYFYEFGIGGQHVALAAGLNGGKAYVAGAAAPQVKWEDDGVKLRSAAISLALL